MRSYRSEEWNGFFSRLADPSRLVLMTLLIGFVGCAQPGVTVMAPPCPLPSEEVIVVIEDEEVPSALNNWLGDIVLFCEALEAANNGG